MGKPSEPENRTTLAAGQTWVVTRTGRNNRKIIEIFPGGAGGRLVRFETGPRRIMQTEAEFRSWMRVTAARWKEADG